MQHEEIYQHILDKIAKGILKPGDKLRESNLSEEVGVSRTPLRQALFQLANGKFLNYEKNVGFHVPPLSRTELQECYPIIWNLEILSLEQGFSILKGFTKELDRLNSLFLKSKAKPDKAYKYDAEFHDIICNSSGNHTLKKLIQDLKLRSARYDLAYFGDTSLIELSFEHHQDIIDGIQEGNFEKSKQALRENWECGLSLFLNSTILQS